MTASLYIHIPYCGSACPYCDFAFVVGREYTADRYVEALKRELDDRTGLDTGPFETVYLGGGTPSSLDPALIGELLESIDTVVGIDEDAEITLEADPLHEARYAAYRARGVTRLSIGVQSFSDCDLRVLGRRHSGHQSETSVLSARSAGFDSLNVDLIFGAPEQTFDTWRATVERALHLGPEHTSIYGLTIEPETPFGRRHARGRLPIVSEEDQARMFEWTDGRLRASGYEHYEISNYALPGCESRHNLACWSGRPYIGLGASAHSFDGRRRSWNERGLDAYLDAVEITGHATVDDEILTDTQRQLERLMLGLRTSEGIDADWVVEKEDASTAIDTLVAQQVIEQKAGRLRLTSRGRLVADAVCKQIAGFL